MPEQEGEAVENLRLDQTAGALDQVSQPDVVRLSYRDMGAAPLLTREKEVELAQRIERGRLRVSRAMSRSPIVIRQILNLEGQRPTTEAALREVAVVEERGRRPPQDAIGIIEEIQELVEMRNRLQQELLLTPKKRRAYGKLRCALARQQVLISRVVRKLQLTDTQQERLINEIGRRYQAYRSLEEELKNLERRTEKARGDTLKALKKELQNVRNKMGMLQREAG